MSKRYALLIGSLYILAFPYHPALRSPNELCRLWQTRALVEYGTLDINRALRDYGPVGDLSFMGGKFYPSKAPLLSVADVPVYAVLKWLGGGGRDAVSELLLVYVSRLFLTVLPSLFLFVLVRRFLGTFVRAAIADAVTLTYAFGTLALSYSLLFMSHQTTAVLLFSAFYALWRTGRGELGLGGYLVAGACAGATVAAEYTGALGVLGLGVYLLAQFHVAPGGRSSRLVGLLKASGLMALGALPFLAALAWYHWRCFGSPLETGYRHLADAAYQPWHLGGFLGIRTPDPRAFVLSFFSPLRGLFALSPFLVLALPGIGLQFSDARVHRERWPLVALSLSLLLGYAYFTSSFAYDSWGWTTGPRHMTGLLPFLLLPTSTLLAKLRASASAPARCLFGAGAALCVASVGVTGALSLVNYVPDDVSNGFYGLALPMLRSGYLPPSTLSFFRITTPWAGLPALFLLGAGGILVAWRLLAEDHERRSSYEMAAFAATSALFFFVLSLAQPTVHDAAAVNFLKHAWVAPPGTSFPSQ